MGTPKNISKYKLCNYNNHEISIEIKVGEEIVSMIIFVNDIMIVKKHII